MPRGRPRNLQRRRQIAELRATGLTYQQIARCLGISHQSVQQALQGNGNVRLVPIRCRECGEIITRMRTVADHNGPVYCLACLPGEATFGQRLKARRLAKGISLTVLSERTGVAWNLLSKYERDVVEPKCRTLIKLIRVLGTEIIHRP